MPMGRRTIRKCYFVERVKKLRRMMSKVELDAFFVTKLSCVRYLCGFTGSSGCLLILPRKTIFMTDNRYREQALAEVVCDELCILTANSLNSSLVDYAREMDLKRIGVEGKNLSYWQYMTLKEALASGFKMVPCEDWIESLRQCKDEMEIDRLRRAARIGDQAFRKVLDVIREGMTERELFFQLRNLLEECGGQKLSFDAIVLFGARTSLIHGQPSNVKLKKGQLILMDFGTTFDGYCSDMTRTVAFGKPSDEIVRAYRAVQSAQRWAALSVKAGRRAELVDTAARKSLAEAGYGDYFLHSTGHSVGLDIHEDPRVAEQANAVLKENMVVTIEPGVYFEGKFGIRIEDMVRVAKDGPDILTRTPRKLMVL